ncbi:MAG: LysR family transcriptional regulator [Hyphomicrobiaceae bacterium]|nr:LysR family transcriptional regulator [Hyphomicrobiaceae bacterium]MCC0008673.1 LysR family transcriptional regulator [Hyphomicrobiaceae bacterium]
MEVHEMRYFLAVSETLNFTRAAELCHVSQPALTRAIKGLEDKLGGGPLIHRERGNTHLTELGRMMKPFFEQAVDQIESARATAKSFVKLESTTLTIGLMCTIGPRRLIEFFTRFNESYKGIDIHLKDGPVKALEDQLARGEIDLAICCRPEELDADFHAMPLFRERFVVAMSPDHPLTGKDVVTISDLDGQRYLSRANCEYAEYLRGLRMALGNVELHRRYVSERDDWVQSMVMAGLGITYLPEFSVSVPGLVTRPLTDPEVFRTIKLVTVRGRPHSPAVGAFVHEVRRHRWQDSLAASARAPYALSA